MQDITQIIQKVFEEIKIEDETWFEFWSARDLMRSLGYKKWERFSLIIKKAKINCENSWWKIIDNFLDEKEFFQEVGKTSKWWRPRENYYLTRYACYLIALNWDSRLEEISLAKTYFATQTRKLEITEQEIENTKRLEARKKLKKSESEIEETIYKRWIKLPVEFATFKNKWIKALYWLSVKALKARKWIPIKRALADFDTELELKAKDFVYAMTDHNIKDKNIIWKDNLETELVNNSEATRKTLIDRWITPEKLKPQEDLKKIEKKQNKKLSNPKKEKLN
jgi:DNA-damage-inducible protein D